MNELIAQILRSTVELIDTVAPRGGLRGEELLNVGLLRQRTIEVLQQAEAEAQKGEDKAEPEAETPPAAKK